MMHLFNEQQETNILFNSWIAINIGIVVER